MSRIRGTTRSKLGFLAAAGTLVLSAIGLAAPASAAPASATSSSAACSSNCLTPGDYEFSLLYDGYNRRYLVHVPASYSGAVSVPLVIDYHGNNETAERQRDVSGQLQQSDLRNFIVIWPQSVNNGGSWNGSACCGDQSVDDVGFSRTVIAAVEARTNIDHARIYATGISAGGSMTHRMACDAADLIKSAAPISFSLQSIAPCAPSRPITVSQLHGKQDRIVPFDGGGLFNIPFTSAPDSFARWGQIDGCVGSPERTSVTSNNKSYVDTYTNCSGGVKVQLVAIATGKHPVDNNMEGFLSAPWIWNNVFNQ